MTEAEIDDFVNDAITELEEIRLDAKKAASRGGFTLGFPKVWLKPAEAVFVAIACETECALWVISGH